MKIKKVEFRNFNSYGNQMQTLDFSDSGDFYLVIGDNGSGKCLTPDTEIEIEITDEKTKEKFLNFIKKLDPL